MKFLHVFIIIFCGVSILGAQEAWKEKGADEATKAATQAVEDKVDSPAPQAKEVVEDMAKPVSSSAVPLEVEGDVYTVQKGDTLWGLAGQFYREPFDWRKIWNQNQSVISDPNLIYPNQQFRIPGLTPKAPEPVQEVVAEPPPPPPVEEKAPEPEVPPVLAEPPPPPKKKELESNTFLVDRRWRGDGQIVSELNSKIMISLRDIVQISAGASSGIQPKMRGDIYRKGKLLRNPRSGEKMGYVVHRVGVLEISKEIGDNSSTAVIVSCSEPIRNGDIVRMRD